MCLFSICLLLLECCLPFTVDVIVVTLLVLKLTCDMVLKKRLAPWRERKGRPDVFVCDPFSGSRQHDLFNGKRKEGLVLLLCREESDEGRTLTIGTD